MKKLLALALCLCLIICAAGCTKNETPSSSAETTVPVQTDPGNEATGNTEDAVYELPLTAVSVPVVTENVFADDGTLLSTYEYQNVSVILQDAEVAEKIGLDLMNRIDAAGESAATALESAKTAYTGQDDWYSYYCSVIYNPMRLDANALSFFGTEVIFDGSPRSATVSISVTYDMTSGEPLSLKNILHSDYSADDLCQRIIQGLADYVEAGELYEDYATILEDMFSTNEPVESWYLSDDGLCFYFSPYEIAPYSSSTIISEIPYENLSGLLKDQYFPSEQLDYNGSLNAGRTSVDGSAGDVDSAQFTQFAELALDENGEHVLLYADGGISDVRIQVGSWDEDGTNFIASGTVFAAAGLGPGDAVMLITQFTDVMPELAVSYRSGGEVITLYISQSGADGTILLTSY